MEAVRRASQPTPGAGYRERLCGLGGRPFIDALDHAHAMYGDRLGLSGETQAYPGSTSLPGALEGFAAALRMFALKVTAHVEVERPESISSPDGFSHRSSPGRPARAGLPMTCKSIARRGSSVNGTRRMEKVGECVVACGAPREDMKRRGDPS